MDTESLDSDFLNLSLKILSIVEISTVIALAGASNFPNFY